MQGTRAIREQHIFVAILIASLSLLKQQFHSIPCGVSLRNGQFTTEIVLKEGILLLHNKREKREERREKRGERRINYILYFLSSLFNFLFSRLLSSLL
jgi:hypothetical protein